MNWTQKKNYMNVYTWIKSFCWCDHFKKKQKCVEKLSQKIKGFRGENFKKSWLYLTLIKFGFMGIS